MPKALMLMVWLQFITQASIILFIYYGHFFLVDLNDSPLKKTQLIFPWQTMKYSNLSVNVEKMWHRFKDDAKGANA